MLLPALPVGTEQRKEAYIKALRFWRESLQLDKDDVATRVQETLIEQWQQTPEKFDREGRTGVVAGRWVRPLDQDGRLMFTHIKDNKTKGAIEIGNPFGGKSVIAKFIGPYAIFYVEGSLVNAYKTPNGFFICRRLDSPSSKGSSVVYAPHQLDYVRIRNIDPNRKEHCVQTPERRYLFRRPTIQQALSSEFDGLCALMLYRYESAQDRFWLLERRVVDSQPPQFLRIPIRPNVAGMRPARKNIKTSS